MSPPQSFLGLANRLRLFISKTQSGSLWYCAFALLSDDFFDGLKVLEVSKDVEKDTVKTYHLSSQLELQLA